MTPPPPPTPNRAQPDPTQLHPPSFLPPQNNKKKKNERKRQLRDVELRDSAYFNIRALVHDLRPRFIEVLRTTEFWDCKAANEIQTGMKLVMDFYKQMKIEGKEHFNGPHQEGTQEESHQVKQVHEETAEKKLSRPPISLEKKLEGGRLRGSYVVGGSVSRLNFITFTNRTPAVYYGATKESYRSSLCKS